MKYIKKFLLLLFILLMLVSSVFALNGYKMHKTAIENKSIQDKVARN